MSKPLSKTKPTTKTKDAILVAALKVFSRDGFDGASLPRIAKEAGVTHPLILYHFKSKDLLWRHTVEHAFGPLISESSSLEFGSRHLAPLEKLRIIIRVFTHFAARYPEHFALIMSEARTGSPRLRWLRENFADEFLNHLQNILREAQDQKLIQDIPVDHLSFILMGSVLLYFSVNFYLPENADMDALADKHADYVITVLLEGILG